MGQGETPHNTSLVKSTAEVVEGIVKEVPVYQDLLQPAARQLGASLETVAKTVNLALAPIRLVVWGADKLQDFLNTTVAEKLKHVPPDRIITPDPHVAGPTIEALRFVGECPPLREMYANLLAKAMDAATAKMAHPAFVEIINQLTPDEARIATAFGGSYPKFPLIDVAAVSPPLSGSSGVVGHQVILRNFSLLGYVTGCEHPELISIYTDNLCRLGLVEIPPNQKLMIDEVYAETRDHPVVRQVIDAIESSANSTRIDAKLLSVTNLGQQFFLSCVDANTLTPLPPSSPDRKP